MTDSTQYWPNLELILENLYRTQGKSGWYRDDIPYLKRAHERVEEMWNTVYSSVSTIRLVLLAEAPLFGPNEAYIYNPAAGATEFFTYKDAEALVGELSETSSIIASIRPRKVQMIERLSTAGFLVLDLFPFALKPDFTGVDYQQLHGTPAYRYLFRETMNHHVLPKIMLIKKKSVGRSIFVFRYAGIRNVIESDVRSILIRQCLISAEDTIESIHQGRSVNRERLALLFRRHASSDNRSGI